MDVRLPNGKIIKGVPEGTPKEAIMQKAIASGFATEQDFLGDMQPPAAGEPAPQSLTQQEFEARSGDIPDIYGEIKPEAPKPEPTIGEKIVGAGEAALTAATGATGGTLGMIGGTLQGLAEEIRSGEFGSQEAADRIEQRAADLMREFTYEPRTETGQEYVQAIGEAGEALAPLAGLTGPVQQVAQLGRAAVPQVAKAAGPAAEIAGGVFKYQSPTKQKIGRMLQAGEPDVETAKFKLKEPAIRAPKGAPALEGPQATSKLRKALDIGGPKVTTDKAAVETIKQGFDEGVIAAVKAGSKTDRSKMSKMVDVLERGKKNKAFAVRNRPSDVAGDSLMERVKTIRKTNKEAGQELEKASQELKGVDVDSSPAISRFMNDLDEMGVTLERRDGKITPNFKGSDIEDLAAPELAIKRMVTRLAKDKAPNAYELHRVKKYIDENVTYGKQGEGLGGKTERVLKNLRSGLDQILDENFPKYDAANTKYADTISALDALQDVAGRKMDLSGGSADKATGTLLRRLMSNAQSRVRLLDSIDEIEGAAKKYGTTFDDDLLSQTLFVDELDRVFGPVARTSLQGQVEQAIEGAARATTPTGAGDLLIKGAAKAAEKARGINEANALKSIKTLLSE